MANIVKTQVVEDGPRNVVLKFEGVLDTSNIVAAGQIGASGFTTTLGSRNIAFVAGALAPTVGQYVTFGDGTTTFPAGTYITAITDATHITVNNAAIKTNVSAAVTITGTAGVIVLADPALLAVTGGIEGVTNRLAINRVTYSIEDTLSVYLYWEGTANDLVLPLTGRGKIATGVSRLNTEPTGVTGRLVAATQGWAALGVLSFAVELTLRKYQK